MSDGPSEVGDRDCPDLGGFDRHILVLAYQKVPLIPWSAPMLCTAQQEISTLVTENGRKHDFSGFSTEYNNIRVSHNPIRCTLVPVVY